MKVLIPMTIENCESDCCFWEYNTSEKQMCNFDWQSWKELPSQGIPDWCPLKKFIV